MLSRFASYLCLIILSLVIPFLLNRRDKNSSLFRRLKPVGILFGIIALILIVLAVSSGGLGFINTLKLILFLLCYSMLLAGLCLLAIALGASGAVSQVIVTLISLLMMGTIFYANTFVDASISTELRKVIVQWSINLNPLITIGSQVFSDDMLRLPVIYQATSIHYYPYYYPSLGIISLYYFIISIVSCGIFWLRNRKNEAGKIN